MKLTIEQQSALEAIRQFIKSDNQVFILHGYAGTGKTTLLAHVIHEVKAGGYDLHLMAPTGRAAHILHKKTGFPASTIHRGIYNFDKLEVIINDEDIAKSDFKFHYPISNIDEIAPITIVDEGSMIGNRYNEGELWSFGTNHLLNDLITFAKLDKKGKLIIVGDPAQLPPVKESYSLALSSVYFEQLGFKVCTAQLTEVLRQTEDSALMQNAIELRSHIDDEHHNQLQITEGNNVTRISSTNIVDVYMQMCPEPELEKTVVITYSNATANLYNEKIRMRYFGDQAAHLQNGDVMIVVNNHYDKRSIEDIAASNSPKMDIMNGEFVQVVHWGNEVTHHVPVYENKQRIILPITFVDTTIKLPSGELYECKMITEPILSAPRGAVSITLIKALYIDFCMRNDEVVRNRKNEPEAFQNALTNDPYLNALRVRYGYAITCHKSQGGEWETVFADFDGVPFNKDGNRWMYTAWTRARRYIYVANFSNVNPMQHFSINNTTVTNSPTAHFPQPILPLHEASPYHDTSHAFYQVVANKYNEVVQALQGTRYTISSVTSLPYRERYVICSHEGIRYSVDFIYNSKGMFREPAVDNAELQQVLTKQTPVVYPPLSYEPSTNLMQYLFDIMLKACDSLQIEILKVVEDLEHYQVVYCLRTSSKYAWVTFHINNRGFVTYGAPYAECANDEKLTQLIQNFRNI